MRTRDDGTGIVDLLNPGCGGSVPAAQTGRHSVTDPVPWVSDYREATGVTPIAPERLLEGSLTGVSMASLDATQICLAGGGVRYSLTTDGPAVLGFSDGRQISLPAAGQFSGSL